MSSLLLHTIVEDEEVHGANVGLPQETRVTKVKGRGRGSQPRFSKNSSKRTTPSPQPPAEVRSSTSSRAPSPCANSQFAALSDTGLKDGLTISNWLFERHAFTVGWIPMFSEELANTTGINAMVEIYDQMTTFTWSDSFGIILSNAEADSLVSDIRTELCNTNGSPDCQSSTANVPSSDDAEFILSRISILLHAVKGARQCDDIAKSHGANEADRRHEWDALLLNFFQPVLGQRDVLLERQLNLPRNLAADDSSFTTRARVVANTYDNLCSTQFNYLVPTTDIYCSWRQAAVARQQAMQFSVDLGQRYMKGNFVEVVARYSSLDPGAGKCDAILVIPCSGVATAMLQRISGVDEQENFLKSFMLIQGPKSDSNAVETSQIGKTIGHRQKTTSGGSLQVPSSRISESDRNRLHNPFLYHPDSNQATQKKETILPKNISCDEPSRKDLLLPVLLAKYKKRDESAISTAMNQMKTYLVSAVTFLSELGITNKPVFGLVVNGTLGAITMAWKTNGQIYIMERNVRHYDIRDPLQALQFVSILPRLARHGHSLRRLLEKQLAIIDVNKLTSKPWPKLSQRQEDKRLAAAEQTGLEQSVAQDRS
ncbi:hypothetical protein BD769DRAFT_553310 [Suillus cothurnatus]|nr:hypothetical protein BD769DRAFT_553310 [Suillus cothurnatus]